MNHITIQLMKTNIAQLVIAAVSLVFVSCGDNEQDASKATPAQGSVVVIFNESVPWDKSFELWSTCLGNGGAGDRITVISGPLGKSAFFTITPELAAQTWENRVDIASADDGIVETIKLLKAMEENSTQAVSLPKLLTLIRENITSDTSKVLITSSTLNQDREEPAFSFHEGKYPSDGHLKASINESPFSAHGDELSNLNIVWNDTSVAEDFLNDIHRQSVRRFVTAWIQAQGASIQFGSKSTEQSVVIDSGDEAVEMRVATRRPAPVIINQPTKPVVHKPVQTPKKSETIKESLQERNEVSLEVQFDLDSATIRDESHPLLESAAAAMSDIRYQNSNFLVEGHTSQEGSAQHNQKLSERRAASVRDALVRYGVDADRLSVIGFGFSKPVYVGQVESLRSANRRVVLRILDSNLGEHE